MAKAKTSKNVPIKSKTSKDISVKEYSETLANLKQQIRAAQLKASLAVNKELIFLYWNVGKTIVERQEQSGWGTNFIEKLSKDIQNTFPGVEGFSRTNIFRMRAFYNEYKIVPPVAGQIDEIEHLGILTQIPWSHNIILMEKLSSIEKRLWYAQMAIENGWSKRALEDWIESNLYARQGKAITNFSTRLIKPQSQLAQEILKNPYNIDFIELSADYREKELEQGLIDHIQKFLIELGQGFAFVGRQYPIEVDGETSYIDLLFYHTRLHCYVPVELKRENFKPDFIGQMNYYLSAIDDKLKTDRDDPSIGLILCKYKSKLKVEYALRDFHKPIGVAGYAVKIMENLPKNLEGTLPSVKEIEAELEKG